jgi:TetR/AcrR family transcriptional repressor of nem operon
MPRTREFEPTEALHRAMLLFWQKGYLDTSIDDLVEATGVSRYGFYSTFGDKRDLFLKAMAHYSHTVIYQLLRPLETADASVAEIHGYFNTLLTASQSSQAQSGCLIGNMAMELPVIDAAIAAHIDSHFARMRQAFHNALQNAQQHHDLAAGLDIEAYADYLVGVAMGFLVCLRARMAAEVVQRFIQTALNPLN